MKKLKNGLPVLAKKLSIAYGHKVRLVGPYLCQDGRKRVDVKGAPAHTGLNKTIQLARARLEVKLGRPLNDDETVDHINNDYTDDSYGNVQVLSLAANAAKQTEEARRKAAEYSRTPEGRARLSAQVSGELNGLAALTDDAVEQYREKFASGSVTVKRLETLTGLTNRSVRNMLDGVSYKDAGGPLRKPRSYKRAAG